MTDQLVVDALRHTYGSGSTAVEVLRGVSFTIDRGEVVGLVGPSGSGKTTLLNCIAGLDSPTSGSVSVFGTTVGALDDEEAVSWRRSSVAIVFQAPGLLGHLSARENIDMTLRARGVGRADREARVLETLRGLRLVEHSDHRPAELSGGQQQRVSLARAIAAQPDLMIADEPTGQLDSDTAVLALEYLRAVAAEHRTTVLIATHDPTVLDFVDRVVHLRAGTVEEPS